MQAAMYQSLNSGFRFCVMTRLDNAEDIAHIERSVGCKFVKWM